MAIEHQAKLIAVGNQKGGVGKTSNTVHLARALVELGRKVLIVDLDMNRGATRHFGINPDAFMGTFEMLVGDEPATNLIIDHREKEANVPKGLAIIPSSRKLEGIAEAIANRSKFMTPRDILRGPLAELQSQFDYIFLDTAPNATLPTIAAYMAADYFVLSAMPDPFAVEGLNDAMRDIVDARQNGNRALTVLGVIISGGDTRTRLANHLTGFVENAFKTNSHGSSVKFKTSISRSTVIPNAQDVGKTVFETARAHKVAKEYMALAKEVEERLKEMGAPMVTTSIERVASNG